MTPLSGVKAVLGSVLDALNYRLGWIAIAYAFVSVLSLIFLLLIEAIEEAKLPNDERKPVLAEVLGRAKDQAARLVVTFNIGFLVFTISLALRGTGAQLSAIMWFRAFPGLGFAIVQLYSVYRWRKFFMKDIHNASMRISTLSGGGNPVVPG